MQSAPEGADFGEITQNKGHGAGQGHSRSPISVPIESSYTIPSEGFPWDDLRKMFRGCQRMAKIPSGVETLPKISTG